MKEEFSLVYKTSITPFFPICLVGKGYSGKFKELTNRRIKTTDVFVLIDNGMVNWFFTKGMRKNAEKIFSEIFSSKNYLSKIKKKEKLISQQLFKEIKMPAKKLFDGKRLNREGEEKLKKIFGYYAIYGKLIDAPGFLFQLYISDKIKEEIFDRLNKSDNEKNEIFNYLLSSHKKTSFERFLFLLAKNLNNKKTYSVIARRFYW
ncbi:unnamed protein product, partial [marine sediment metagenome]